MARKCLTAFLLVHILRATQARERFLFVFSRGAARGSCVMLCGAAWQVLAILALCFILAGTASANPETQPDSRAHIIVGMTPNTQFAVTCDDSLLTPDPIESDELGILTFSTDENQEGSPVTIWVGTPAPPEISDVAACAVSDTYALICWNTDRPATSQVEFGTTDSYGSTTIPVGGLTTIHAVYIFPLEPETLYHYRAVSMDAFDNTTKSGDYTVVTDAPHLRISNFGASDPTTHSITVNWTTSEPADSRVVYGLDHFYGNATPLDPEFVSEHSVVIDGLQPGITYHFRAWSTDADGQTAVSVDGVATTETSDLEIFDVAVIDTTSLTATISWNTTVAATAIVEYGLTKDYGMSIELSDYFEAYNLAVLIDLSPATLYHYRIVCTSLGGDQVMTPDMTLETQPPGHPDDLVFFKVMPKHVGWDSAIIGWITNMPATSIVEYGTTPEYGSEVSSSDYVTCHAMLLEGLDETTTYYYRVRSVTEAGIPGISGAGTFATVLSPLEITDLASESGVGFVTLTWTTNRPSDSRVEYGSDENYGSVTPLFPELVTDHSITVDELLSNEVYHFRAWSIDDHGFVAGSQDHTVIVPAPELIVESVAVSDTTDVSVVINWTTSHPAWCRVEYGVELAFDLAADDELGAVTAHTIELIDLLPSTNYDFRIVATDGYGQETTSDVHFFETRSPGFQNPLEMADVSVYELGPTYARISWITDRPATSEVQFGTSPDYTSTMFDGAFVTEHELLLTGLDSATEYHFRAFSVASNGAPASSEDGTFETLEAGDYNAPSVPQALTVTPDMGAVTIRWAECNDPDLAGYRLYRRSEMDTVMAFLVEVSSGVLEFADESAIRGIQYGYAVSAVDESGNESERSVVVEAVAGTGTTPRVWVFPNPITDGTTLRISPPASLGQSRGDEPWEYAVRIYDASGRLVRTVARGWSNEPVVDTYWDAEDARGEYASSGVYFCEVTIAGRSARSKLIVIR